MQGFEEREFPVRFIDDNGEITHDPVLGMPCVQLHVMAPAVAGTEQESAAGWFLVDTGAEYVYVSKTYVDALHLPLTQSARGVIINGTENAFFHDAVLATPDDFWAIKLPVVRKDFVGTHPKIAGAIGRQFLMGCRWVFDGKNKDFHLTLFRPAA